MKLEEFQSLFAARIDAFYPIFGNPTNADIMLLYAEVTKILLPIVYDVEKGVYNLMGLVMDEYDYK